MSLRTRHREINGFLQVSFEYGTFSKDCMHITQLAGYQTDMWRNVQPRVTAFNLGSTTLLLFELGSTHQDITINTEKSHGIIPGHGPNAALLQSGNSLKQHFCFAVKSPEDVDEWNSHLEKSGVRILGRMNWELGGKSVYFEDPDGHVGEIGSKGIWKHYW